MGSTSQSGVLEKLKTKKISLNFFQRQGHSVNVAIDIRYKSVIIAVSERKKGEYVLTKLEEKVFSEKIDKDSEKFQKWLKNICKALEKEFSKPFYWILISSKFVDTFYFTIPKVNKSKIDHLVEIALKRESKGNLRGNVYDYSIIGEKQEDGIEKLEVFAYIAQKEYIGEVAKLADKLDLQPLGISAYHLTLSNLFRGNGTVAHFFLGTDWSRIDIYKGGYLVFNRDIKTGFVSFANEIIENIKASEEVEITVDLSGRDIKEHKDVPDLTQDDVKKYFMEISSRGAAKGPYDNKLSGLDLKKSVSSSLQRLILQIRRTMEFYSSSTKNPEVNKIYVSGVIDLPDDILEEIEKNLGIKVKKLRPVSDGLVGSKLNINIPEIKESDYAPVVACSIQEKNEFNFLSTRFDRQKDKLKKIVSTSISVFFVSLTICLSIYYLYLSSELKNTEYTYQKYLHQLRSINPVIDGVKLKKIAEILNNEKLKVKKASSVYRPISLIKDLARLTPGDIKWTKLHMDVPAGKLRLDVAIKNYDLAKLKIANYILTLKSSPLVSDVVISGEKTVFYSKNKYYSYSIEVSF
ncbi:hypothetical protein [Desulfothermus okinawensis]